MEFFRIFFAFCLIFQVLSVPVPQASEDFKCSGDNILNYKNGQDYTYEYETDTTLFINDISDEAKSELKLKTNVVVSPLGQCNYMLRLKGTHLTGESMSKSSDVDNQLDSNVAVFRMNSEGELDSSVDFQAGDSAWSKNIKRAIISAFQVKSYSKLRSADGTNDKSSVTYETDVLGRCRTTYSVEDGNYHAEGSYSLEKKKSLQRCTLVTSQANKYLGAQYVPYKQIPEFFDGRLFIEDYSCKSVIKDNLVSSVECKEVSTFKPGSRGIYGVQAIVSQNLNFVSQGSNSVSRPSGLATESISFEYYDSKSGRIETEGFDSSQFMNEICENALEFGLSNEHSMKFKDLTYSMKDWSVQQMVDFYTESKGKCDMAGLTSAQAIVFTKTDNSVEAALSLVDSDSFADQKYITEYPILTALARNPEPSHELVEKLKEYLSSKSSDFPYYNKLALIYSTLAYTHCTNIGCSESQKEEFSSVFAESIKSDCSVIGLKAVGNIGAFADLDALNKCASDKSNSLESRVVTAQAVRRFSCANVDKMQGLKATFGDRSEDSEVRISAFLALVRCLDDSKQAQEASKKLPEFLLAEEDHQVFVFVVRYGKEHGLSTILNAALDDPRIRAKFETNIKTLSFTRFRYHYNVLRDAAVEAETTVIYTPQTWIPRSINFNLTTHAFGASVNMIEANLRLEGMDEILKAAIIDKLRSEKFMKRIMEDPQQLIDILQIVADKLQYQRELPKMTMSMRVYGSDVMYSNIDNKENFLRLANFIKSPRQTILYRQVETVKNFFLIDTEIRQPLVNGLSFNRYLDISSALLLSKQSNKDKQDNELSFHVNNFWSMSGSFRGIFEVAFNEENKLSLKKKSMVNARLRLNVEGFKKEGNWKYNVHLTPMTQIPLFTADGQFYKLVGNSYNKVNEFKTQQKEYEVCNSEKFDDTFGLKLCFSVSRPQFGNVVQILRGRRQGDLQNDFAQYLDDMKNNLVNGEDNFHDANNKRPTLILAGPYHYELRLVNPQLIKTVVFDVKFDRSLARSDVSVDVSTVSQGGEETKKVELVYSRERQTFLRGIHRRMSIQLKNVESNEVRFNFLAQFLYRKQEVLNFHLEVENKVLRPFHHKLTFGRDKSNEDNIVPKYHLEVIMDRSQTSMKKKYNLYFDMTPNGRDVSSKWYLEGSSARTQFKTYRVANGEVTMTSNSDDMFDYTVKLHAYNKLRQANLDVTGNILLSLFKSDVNLVIDYKNPRVNLPKPANLRFSHKFDASSNAQSYVSAHVDHAYRYLDHGFKATFVFDVTTKKLSLFHLDLNKPGPNPTCQLFFEKNESDGSTSVKDVKFGVRNTQIYLPSAAGTLIKVDDQRVLRSLVIHFTRTHTKGAKIAHELYAKKNEKVFVTIKDSVYGDRAAVRNNLLELPKTSFGVDFYMKVLDNSGAFSLQLDLEASKSNQKYAAEFNAKTENLFKILSRIASYNVKFHSSKNDFNAQLEMKRLGEVKGFKLYSTSGLRRNGNSAEFDMAYEKRLANGKKLTGNGFGAFTFDNFKNFETSAQIDGHYNHKLSVKNSRDESQTGLFGYHNFQFENSHLDFEPYSRKIVIFIEDTRRTAGNFDFKVDFRKGQVNNLNNRDALLIFSSVSSENSFANGRLAKSLNGLNVKSARFNLDFEKESNFVMNSEGVKYDAKTNLKVPAIITDPGKLNTLNHEFVFTCDQNKKATLMNRFKTDSKLFGRLFRVLNIDFDREVNANTNLVNANLEVNYRLRRNPADSEMKNWRFKIEHDLHTKTFKEALQKGYKLKVNVKQNRFNKYSPRFLLIDRPYIKVTDCTYDEVLKREKTSSKYYLDLDLNIACNGVLFSNTGLTIDRVYDEDNKPSTRVQLDTSSDVFYNERHIKLAHDKFTKKHGLVSVSINGDGRTPFANKFYYDRSVNPITNKMNNAHYHVATSFGPALSKACDFNVVSGVDLYNSFSCRLNTTKVPNVELNYGYNYKSTNVEDRITGKRNFELDIIVPGRTLRAEYNRNYPSYFDGNDDDEDPNNEREFNATAVLYWDYVKQPNKFLTINAKRDNFAKGKSTTFVELVDSPHFKFLRFKVDKTRTHNDTTLAACAMYEMKNGNKNCLTVTGKLSSNLNTNSLSIETDLERPSFNTLYENRFNKHNGRLQYLGIRVGKVLKLSVDKEYDPEERRVSVELTNPDESKYTFEGKSDMHDEVYTVEGTLSQNSKKLSNVVSKFDARNANFDVKIKGLVTGNSYRLNFGVFDETLANAYIKNEKSNEIIGKTELKVVKSQDNEHELVMSMKWNRFWGQVQKDILGNTDENLAEQNDQFNSYFGDVYGEVTKDLKPLVSVHRQEREKIKNDFRNLFGILLDFYSNFLNSEMRSKLQRVQMQQMAAAMEAQLNTDKDIAIYKKVLRKYNAFAKRMTALSLYLRRYSKNWSRAVPRFPTYEYNQQSSEFQNNLVIRRPTLYAQTLYQFNHEYRDYVRKAGQRFLALKGTLVRPNLGGMGLKALYNKYKYRSLSSYTLVGHVFNKRNIIGFDGEPVVLQSRCQYLLAHETHKNRFSVVLNFQKGKYPISVYAYGKSVDIGYSSAAIEGQAVSLPQRIGLGEDNGMLVVNKNHDSVCVELNKDMKVCCYDDSKSCTVAATRWFTGKLNGLLGKADNDPQEINQQDWFLKSTCRFPNAKTRLPSESAIKTCYSLFGRHRKAAFRNAIQTIKPDAWQKICASVLTANIKYKCAVMRAFVHHARQLSVSVNAADECFSCQLNKHNYAVGQSVARYAAGSPSNFAKGSDVAMILLPCSYKQQDLNKLDIPAMEKSFKKFKANSENRMAVIRVEADDASIYQSKDGQTYNSDDDEAFNYEKDGEVSEKAFEKAMFLAGSFLTQRLAENRIIVINSCGNCLPYKFKVARWIKIMKKGNVVVHALGDYNIKDLESDDLESVPFAYGFDKVHIYNKYDKSVEKDYLDDYKIDHEHDMCSRLAVKTGGLVLRGDKNHPETAANKIDLMFNEHKKFNYNVQTCRRIDTPYGDLTDFSYTRTEIEQDSEDFYDY